MTWDYRVIKHDLVPTNYFAIHEVYYDENGKITNWSEKPIDVSGETKSEVIKTLKHMIADSEQATLKESELEKLLS